MSRWKPEYGRAYRERQRLVNPAHMEIVTHKENSRRASHWWGQKPNCKNGHPFAGSNLIIDANGKKVCRTCARARSNAYRARQRTVAA